MGYGTVFITGIFNLIFKLCYFLFCYGLVVLLLKVIPLSIDPLTTAVLFYIVALAFFDFEVKVEKY